MSGQVHRLKHERIASELAREIRTGRLPVGSQLPGEHLLASKFQVSRNTVRQALTALARRGLIDTHSGKGSFVTFDGQPLDDTLGWTRALADQGVPTEVVLLRLELVEDPVFAERVGLAVGTFVAVDRLRSIVDGRPISLERSRVPAIGNLRDLPRRGLSGSLATELLDAGLVGDRGEEWVELSTLDRSDAELLGRAEGERFLHARRLAWTVNGEFVEHVESLLDPDRFRLHLRFGGDPA